MNNKKICKFCHHYKLTFVIYEYLPIKSDVFYCTKRKTVAEENDTCTCWQKKRAEYDLSLQRFEQAEEDVRALINALKQ